MNVNKTPGKSPSKSTVNTNTNVRRHSISPNRRNSIDVRKAILEASKVNNSTNNSINIDINNSITTNHDLLHEQTLHDENIRLNNLLDNYKKKINKLTDELNDYQNQNTLLNNQINELTDENKQLVSVLDETTGIIKQLEDKYNHQRDLNNELLTTVNKLTDNQTDKSLVNTVNTPLTFKSQKLEQSLKYIQ
mmetsp:Transcript_18866/g.17075  ORF Transcript_18866/g.17075 Transcript_18866/m.17075 type:complete len:192 (-) Transcript_18866:113-688(-)